MGNCISRRKYQPNISGSIQSPETAGQIETPTILHPKERNSIILPRRLSEQKLRPDDNFDNAEDNQPTFCYPDTSKVVRQISSANSAMNQHDSATGSDIAGMPEKDFLNGGYWPSWKHYENIAPSSIPVNNITHVNYAFADIDGDGTVYLADEHVHYQTNIDGTYGCLRAWTKRRKDNRNLKVILAIGGGASPSAKSFAEVSACRHKRSIFTHSVKALIDKFELDGIDVDWEYPTGSTEAGHYLRLLKDLRQILGRHQWVTTALPASQWALEKLDLVQISKTVDFINLMAYDFVGPTFANVQRTQHQARLHVETPSTGGGPNVSGAGGVEYLLRRGVPPRKIMLGIPLYGRSFNGATGPNEPFSGPGSGNDATHEVKELPRPGMIEIFDERAIAAYATGNGEFITYDNQDSVRHKAEWARQHNLRGLFYWHLAGDRLGNASLVREGYKVLIRANGGRCETRENDKNVTTSLTN